MNDTPPRPTSDGGDEDLRDERLSGQLDRLAPPSDLTRGLQHYRNQRTRRLRRRRAKVGVAGSALLVAAAVITAATLPRPSHQDVTVAGPPTTTENSATSAPFVFSTSTTAAWTKPTTRSPLVAPAIDSEACPNYVSGLNPAMPPGFSVASEDDPRLQQSAASQGEALPTIELLQQYATTNPDGYFNLGLEWAGNTATPFISYSGDIAQHCAAIAALLGEGVRWVIRWNAYSSAELRQLAAELTDQHGPIGDGLDNGVLTLRLDPDQRALADQLLEQYSPKLAVILGAHPYPDLARSTATCPQSGLTGDHAGGLTARLLRPSTLRSGSKVQIDVEFTNSTDKMIELPQPLQAYLGDGHRILSTNAHEAQLAVLYPPIIVQPGQSITTPVDVSTAACNPADGYQLPPGNYIVEIPLGTTWVSAAITVTP